MKISTPNRVSIAILTVILLLTACDNASNKPSQPTASATASTSVTLSSAAITSSTSAPAPTPIYTALDPKTFAGHETAGALAVAMSNFMLRNLNETQDLAKLPADKKTCLLNSNHQATLPQYASYLSKKLTPEELKKTNAFYASELGQKVILSSEQKIKQQAGMSVSNPVTLSEEDTAKLKVFANTPEGKKLMALFSPENQLEMQRDMIEPTMQTEFERCGVKLVGMK